VPAGVLVCCVACLQEAFSGMACFDQIPLLQHSPATAGEGVYAYVDDQGAAKGLAVNRRASAIAALATGGVRPLQVLGDVFIGRVIDDDKDIFQRRDFTIAADLRSDAEWIKAAAHMAKANAEKNGSAAGGGAAGGGSSAANEQIKALLSSASRPKNCGADGCARVGTQRCSRCKRTYYCSEACQRSAWAKHKPLCTPSKAKGKK
jgi:hypothetical protein